MYSEAPTRLGPLVRALQGLVARLPVRMLQGAGLEADAGVLDAGAGRGRLVRALCQHGYRAEGIDPSPRGSGVARAAIAEYTAEELDAVVLWHVLEHVDEPAAALGQAAGWLKPGGVAVIATPNVGSLQARLAGARWFHLDVPRHRTHFSARGLRALIAGSGLEVVSERHFVAEHNPLGMWFALLTRLGMTPGFPFHLLKRNVPLKARDVVLLAVAGPLLAIPAVLLELLAAAMRRGGTVAVVARRQADS
jgi:SAM-dependent methyltransferase